MKKAFVRGLAFLSQAYGFRAQELLPVRRYHSLYAACNPLAAPGTESMVDVYRRIAPKLRTTLVFNGDTDPCVSYEGTRKAIGSVFPGATPGGEQRPSAGDAFPY